MRPRIVAMLAVAAAISCAPDVSEDEESHERSLAAGWCNDHACGGADMGYGACMEACMHRFGYE